MSTTVHDVAKYILVTLDRRMTAMQLQKLTYYCQAWHLVMENRPLFQEEFQAWANGPVCYELFGQHRGRWAVGKDDIVGDWEKLTFHERKVVHAVLNLYSAMPAHQLSELTHSEDPWRLARGTTPEGERSTNVISTQVMTDFYRALADESVVDESLADDEA